jgi:hypothetical protein
MSHDLSDWRLLATIQYVRADPRKSDLGDRMVRQLALFRHDGVQGFTQLGDLALASPYFKVLLLLVLLQVLLCCRSPRRRCCCLWWC